MPTPLYHPRTVLEILDEIDALLAEIRTITEMKQQEVDRDG